MASLITQPKHTTYYYIISWPWYAFWYAIVRNDEGRFLLTAALHNCTAMQTHTHIHTYIHTCMYIHTHTHVHAQKKLLNVPDCSVLYCTMVWYFILLNGISCTSYYSNYILTTGWDYTGHHKTHLENTIWETSMESTTYLRMQWLTKYINRFIHLKIGALVCAP